MKGGQNMSIEEKIKKDKVTRKHEIQERISMIIIILIIIWLFACWMQVVHHNIQYYYGENITSYSWWNIFNLLGR